MFPDYSIYPEYDYAVAMTSRGCPRGCSFCHVVAKEGRCAHKVADVSNFWRPDIGKKEIKILDPNITACPDKRELMRQYIETGCKLDFTQGLDIRCLNDADIDDLNQMRIKRIHFAWDNPTDRLEKRFANFSRKYRRNYGKTVYILTNYGSSMDENLYRIHTLADMGYDPYVMIYNKPSAPKEVRHLQRWCNNKLIFKKVKTFREYNRNEV